MTAVAHPFTMRPWSPRPPNAMCRLFGFRSVIRSQVHHSLLDADNALGVQSEAHPDGWGVAYYIGGAPHLIKSSATALSDQLFHRVSGIVAAETVVAHIRNATQGEMTPINAHPFQYGRWIFAHNGNLKDFPQHREALLSRIPPELRRYVLGTTDSEVLFYLLLGHVAERGDLHDRELPMRALMDAVEDTVAEVQSIVGPLNPDDSAPPTETFLTFVITNERLLLAHQGGKRLYWSTWKHKCPERDVCPSFGASCEAATRTGFVNHLVVTSEPLHGQNVWLQMEPGEIVAVDGRMRLHRRGAGPGVVAAGG